MRMVRFGVRGEERYGLVDRNGEIRDASMIALPGGEVGLEGAIDELRNVNPADLPIAPPAARLGCPLARVGKIICVGLNYRDHAAESGMAIPSEPVLLMKATTAISGPNDDICIPPGARKVDWEVELGVVIGRRATRISTSEALDHVAGYVLVHDVSERAYQLEGTGEWMKGKSLDSFCPVGPWLVTRDEIQNPQNLRMCLDVNGQRMQAGSTEQMIFGIEHLVAYVSRFMTLEPGDLISTGTPAGVGLGRRPPVYLKDGDEVELSVERLGTQRQRVRQLTK